jgi:hypothetical protein
MNASVARDDWGRPTQRQTKKDFERERVLLLLLLPRLFVLLVTVSTCNWSKQKQTRIQGIAFLSRNTINSLLGCLETE